MAKTKLSQSLFLLLFLGLFLIISTTNTINFQAFPLPTNGRIILENSQTSKEYPMQVHSKQSAVSTATATTTTTTTTANDGGAGTASQQYGMAAHEVPSGANPESNR